MFNNKSDIIKKLNMKIAGTLPSFKADAPVEELKDEDKEKDKVWDVNMEGLTAK